MLSPVAFAPYPNFRSQCCYTASLSCFYLTLTYFYSAQMLLPFLVFRECSPVLNPPHQQEARSISYFSPTSLIKYLPVATSILPLFLLFLNLDEFKIHLDLCVEVVELLAQTLLVKLIEVAHFACVRSEYLETCEKQYYEMEPYVFWLNGQTNLSIFGAQESTVFCAKFAPILSFNTPHLTERILS